MHGRTVHCELVAPLAAWAENGWRVSHSGHICGRYTADVLQQLVSWADSAWPGLAAQTHAIRRTPVRPGEPLSTAQLPSALGKAICFVGRFERSSVWRFARDKPAAEAELQKEQQVRICNTPAAVHVGCP